MAFVAFHNENKTVKPKPFKMQSTYNNNNSPGNPWDRYNSDDSATVEPHIKYTLYTYVLI